MKFAISVPAIFTAAAFYACNVRVGESEVKADESEKLRYGILCSQMEYTEDAVRYLNKIINSKTGSIEIKSEKDKSFKVPLDSVKSVSSPGAIGPTSRESWASVCITIGYVEK